MCSCTWGSPWRASPSQRGSWTQTSRKRSQQVHTKTTGWLQNKPKLRVQMSWKPCCFCPGQRGPVSSGAVLTLLLGYETEWRKKYVCPDSKTHVSLLSCQGRQCITRTAERPSKSSPNLEFSCFRLRYVSIPWVFTIYYLVLVRTIYNSVKKYS